MAVTFSKHYPLAGNLVVDTIVLETFTEHPQKPVRPVDNKSESITTSVAPKKDETVIEKKETKVAPEPQKDHALNPGNDQDRDLTSVENKVGLNVKDFHYDWYIRLILKKIQENWKPPVQKHKIDNHLIAKVDFQVNRNGKISDIKLQEASGNFLYDQAALRTLQNIGQFPPLPNEYNEGSIIVHLEFKVN